MLYDLDSSDDAKRYSATAVQLIDSYEIPSNPDYFRLFYDYASERDPVVSRALSHVIDETPDVIRNAATELLRNHYGEDQTMRLLANTGDAMREQIEQVVSQVSTAGSDVGEFGDALSGLEDGLGSIEGGRAMKTLVGQMIMATQQMRSKSEQLEQDLKQSANEIQNLQDKLEDTRREALTDVLTGITNRAGFDRALQRHCDLAAEEGEPLVLVMCDIDHFKKFNDSYGHQLGDQVLKLVGAVLRDGLKGRDVPCRYGGEEFALILPETDIDAGAAAANNLRNTIASRRIVRKSSGEEISRVTMSFGVAGYQAGEKLSALIGRADAALYRSKDNGRNRVTTEGEAAVKLAAAS